MRPFQLMRSRQIAVCRIDSLSEEALCPVVPLFLWPKSSFPTLTVRLSASFYCAKKSTDPTRDNLVGFILRRCQATLSTQNFSVLLSVQVFSSTALKLNCFDSGHMTYVQNVPFGLEQ